MRALTPLMLLMLVVLHAPTQAQAAAGTNEPMTLLLTGVALLGLSRVGRSRHR